MKPVLTALLCVTLAACGTLPAQTPAADQPVTRSAPVSTTSFLAAYNNLRAQQGLGTMRENAALTRAAQRHARDMENRNYFSHRSEGGPHGANLQARARSAGCDLRSGAENLAQGQTSEFEVFAAWRDSRGHRVNLLNRKYTQYGLGRAGDTWVMKLSSGC